MLLEPVRLKNGMDLKNHIVMAPMTRCFADENLVPTDEIAAYYERRADAGLIITEGVIISPIAQGYPNTPGLYSDAQVAGWRKVTDRVHAAGGKIAAQIWHVGRASHSIYHGGALPVAPSAIALEGRVARTKDLTYETPRALTLDEIAATIEDYKIAAINAVKAGFDIVEIHGANGYLVDQFLHQASNVRTDAYGGSTENRARFALEVVEAVIDGIGADKTAIRLSPAAYFNLTHTAGDEDTFKYLLAKLSDMALAYVHVGIFDDSESYDYLGGRVSSFMRKHYTGTLVGCGSYTAETAEADLKAGNVDLAAIGRDFITHPDLVERLRTKAEILPYNGDSLATLY